MPMCDIPITAIRRRLATILIAATVSVSAVILVRIEILISPAIYGGRRVSDLPEGSSLRYQQQDCCDCQGRKLLHRITC